jgi:hypothetical protein
MIKKEQREQLTEDMLSFIPNTMDGIIKISAFAINLSGGYTEEEINNFLDVSR